MTDFSERQAEILTYCRIDDPVPGDLKLLEALYKDAVSQMRSAGVAEPPSGSVRAAQYNACVNALILDAWDHRGIQTGDKALTDNPAFRRRLNQLKHSEPAAVSDSDTEG